jgi:hypothetical protein
MIHSHYIDHLIGDVERVEAASAWQRLNWYATSQRP